VSEDLPEGWASVQLGDVSDVALGKMLDRAKRTAGKRLPYLRNANVRWGRFRLDDLLEMPFKDDELERFALVAGDLLICEGGEPGRCAIWPGSRDPVKYQKALLRIRAGSAADNRWVMFALRHAALQGDLEKYFTGSTIKHFPREAVVRFDLALPPLEEQRRIIAMVEELLAQVDAARQRLTRVPLILKRFRQSVLAAACSGELIESVPVSEEWPETAVSDLLIDARYGTSDRCHDRIRGAVPVLRVPNIASGKLDLTSLKFAVPQRNWASLMLQDGDILICRTNGSLDLVGKAAVVANLSEPTAFASYLIRLRTNSRALLPRFLHLFLLSPSGRSQITAEARTTAGQFNLNLEILRGLRFVLPPVDAQAEIVRRVDLLFSLAETIERRVAAASERADALTQSVLARAFRGELVPTEAELARAEARGYESAEALLARFRVGRGTSPSYNARHRRTRRAASRS